MRRRRTIYFNDARHYYLFVFEPPMRMEDAWVPVDEVASTSVDTFAYGVSRGDGLFYPSKVGAMFGEGRRPFRHAYEWRSWQNMQSLIARGLDPLTVLIDRAHEKGLEFIASLRMGGYGGMAPEHTFEGGGRGFAHPEVRDHQFAVLQELATQYPVEGVELDFAAAPGGSPFWFRPEEAAEQTPLMTDFLRKTARMVRGRSGGPGQIGARVYPTEELNLKTGLDVHAWIDEGLVDFLVPLIYADFVLDANMPVDWLVSAAHARDISVYGMLQPYCRDESRRFHTAENATPAMLAAAAANLWALDVDGLYTWFLPWPLGHAERHILSDLGHPDRVREADKHYFLRRASEGAKGHEYPAPLPLEIPSADPTRTFAIPFTIADDTASPRLSEIRLRVAVSNLVSADRFEVSLNGIPLSGEPCTRTYIRSRDPYAGQRLDFRLKRQRPNRGRNSLELALRQRPDGLRGGVTIEEIEILVTYGVYPAAPDG